MQTGLYLNPIYNGNWPQVVIERVTFRDNSSTSSRLPTFTDSELSRIRGTSDFLGVNYYLANLISNAEEATNGSSYDNDVRAVVQVDPSWSIGYNNYPVSNTK